MFLLLLVVLPLLIGPVVQTLAGTSKTARYSLMVVALVLLGLAVVAVWVTAGRDIGDLGVGARVGPGFLAATGLAFVFVLYVTTSVCRVADPGHATRARSRLQSVSEMLPDTREQLVWFVALGLVAGTVEELAYRGYILLGLAPGGLWGALVVSAALFGIAHLYQGLAGGAGTALFGLGLGLVTILAGSIIPAILIHVTQDVGTGLISYKLRRDALTAG